MTVDVNLEETAKRRGDPPELEHDTIWRDAGYWCGLHARFIRARPLLGGGVFVALVGGVVLENTVVVKTVVATGALTDALVRHTGREVQAAVFSLVVLALLLFAGSLTAWYGRYAYQFLWRAYFTDLLVRGWFADDRYYHLERAGVIRNPEQRIQEDLYFVGYWTVWLIPFFIGAATSGIYAWMLVWRMSHPLSLAPLGLPLTIPLGLFFACLVTAVVRVVCAHFAGRRVTRLEIIRKRLDADFRLDLSEVREFGEAVAFHRGGEWEKRRALGVFEKIRSNWWRLTTAQMTLVGANSITGTLGRLVAPLVCIQPILAGEMTIGKLVVATSTFPLAMQLIAFFADEYSVIATLRASVARIRLMEQAVESPIEQGAAIAAAASIEAEDLTISRPSGEALAKVLTLRVARGQRIAIGGRSGSGKSTLLRTLAGLWPFASGTVRMPPADSVVFLPQRPYLPEDTLEAVLSYPDDPEHFDRSSYMSALRQCGLPALVGRLCERKAWRKLLSPGEQQRLSAARALLRRPDFLIVDEPTSALDPASEAEIYKALDAGLPRSAILTVAHSRQLIGFHGEELELRDGGLAPKIPVDIDPCSTA